MTLHHAKLRKQGHYQADSAVRGEAPDAKRARVLPKPVVLASERARDIIAAARRQADQIIARAEQAAAEARLRAEAQARANASAELAARAIALRARELASAEHTLQQQIELARVLAERLLGEALAMDETRIVALARQALSEARGARQIVIEAHPSDARLLEQSLASLSLQAGTLQVHADSERPRGDLRIVTELGVLDAALGPQLERLTSKLRESLEA